MQQRYLACPDAKELQENLDCALAPSLLLHYCRAKLAYFLPPYRPARKISTRVPRMGPGSSDVFDFPG